MGIVTGGLGACVTRDEPTHAQAAQAVSSQVLTACDAAHGYTEPRISGTRVVWTANDGTSNFDVGYVDTASTTPAVDLTNLADSFELSPDISGDHIVYTHTSTTLAGDIVDYDLATGISDIIAGSTSAVHFDEPAIEGTFVTFERVIVDASYAYAYDLASGAVGQNRTDTIVQSRPRTDGTWIVYEQRAAADATTTAIMAWRFLSTDPPVAITDGSSATVTPDVDGGVVVYVGPAGGSDQIFLYDLASGTTTQLTTVASDKILPRISAGKVVWSDDRNGDLDVYGYDIASGTEVALVTGAGAQFDADIDGNRIVYTDNASGCDNVAMTTFPAIAPPPTVASIAGDVQQDFGNGDITNAGIENALLSKLAAAAAARSSGDCATADAIYEAFIAQVQAQSGKAISAAAASMLIGDAQYLIDHCP